jgi:hypothetical protein
LEDLDVLLPWNTKLKELRDVGSPEIVEESRSMSLDIDTFHWANMTWLCPAHWCADEILQTRTSVARNSRCSF